MKIVVVGSGGRLGAALARYFGERHEVVALDRRALDLRDEGAIAGKLGGLDYDVLVNAAALTGVDYCEENAREAGLVNGKAPGLLAAAAAGKDARIIHVSTDYVFDGTTPGFRREEDAVNPLSVYSRTKLEGERAVLGVSEGFLVVRTSWVFGPDRPSFVDGMLERALVEDRVEAIEDKFSAPTYSLDFGELLDPLLEAGTGGGVLHLCNDGACSWKEYGQAALEIAAAEGLPLRARAVEGISIREMTSFVAPRPLHTAMSVDGFERLTGRRPRPWREALEAYLGDYFVPRWRTGASR